MASKHRFSLALIRFLDALFQPISPKKRRASSAAEGDSYADWEYRDSQRVHGYVKDRVSVQGETLLDLGCGLGGRAVYYAEQGAALVIGVDRDVAFLRKAKQFSQSRDIGDRVHFVAADAAALPFREAAVTRVMAHSVFEHFDEPDAVLGESHCCLIKGGQLAVTFPPYLQPYGAHLYRHLSFPWPQILFSEQALAAYFTEKTGSADKLSSVNKMTIARFTHLLEESPFTDCHLTLTTKSWLKPLNNLPFLKEYLTLQVAAICTKDI